MGEKGILGIDAGGTFTDLVFWGEESRAVLVSEKTRTLHGHLIQTVQNGLDLILKKIDAGRIRAFNFATTLATNAIVENKLRRAAAIFIGYDAEITERFINLGITDKSLIRSVSGGHDALGNEAAAFDEETFRTACRELFGQVNSVAVSSYFSVRNPAHELRAKQIIEEEFSGIHVTCGHELATELDALKRASTAVLNAGLIPIIIELFSALEDACRKRGICVPIMIVRSDGSLVSMEWAKAHPIETILSGPAASAIGARYLAGAEHNRRGSCVVDIGGTTTDIIFLDSSGHPKLCESGAVVGGHKTLIKSLDIFTFGLGGDSRCRLIKNNKLQVGPRRVKSLCSAAEEDPRVIAALKSLLIDGLPCEPLVVFKGEASGSSAESRFEEKMLALLESGPLDINTLLKDERLPHMRMIELDRMEERGAIRFAGFTPTDAITALGLLNRWDATASKLGAEIMTQQLDITPDDLCRHVCEQVSAMACENVFMKRLSQFADKDELKSAREFIRFSLLPKTEEMPLTELKLKMDVIGVGAPAWAFVPRTAEMMGETMHVTENAETAGAVGAAVGTFFLKYAALISPQNNGTYRAHLHEGVKDFEDLDEAIRETVNIIKPWIISRAESAGAKAPEVEYEVIHTEAEIAGGLQKIHLATHIYFKVVGTKN